MPPFFSIPKLLDKLQEYLKIKGDQIKLEVMGHTARIMALVITFLIIGMIALFLGFFIGLTLAVFLNDILDSQYMGYLIVSGFTLLMLIILIILLKTGSIRKWLETLILKIGDDG